MTTGGTDVRVSGPYSHENLSVFLLHSKSQDGRDFLTLDEGLKSGVVLVSDKGQVNELEIENTSDRPLFLQEGDRVTGGKQDRTVHTSLVIPAKSGKMPLPTFCVEQDRWQEGHSGRAFAATVNVALAPKSVRMAAKVDGNQSSVWKEVAGEKSAMSGSTGAANTTSSLNETLDSPEAKKVSDETIKALEGALSGQDDAVGVAIAVNGKIEEIDIYPGRALLGKLYPRLLACYAIDAANRKAGAKDAKGVSPDDVARFLKESDEAAKKRTEQVNAANACELSESKDKYECDTRYEGKAVHRQVLAK
ncbi:hypothetical protein HY251_13375 [bacterium]|nr:hypothetical protein [bacterium]